MAEYSKELVPLTHARDAYNALHGTQLEHHHDHLTGEQAQRINDSFDIEVHVGTHGIGIVGQATNANQLFDAPTQQEYEEAAAVVESLQPGDTLFTEGYNFAEQPRVPGSNTSSRLAALSDKWSNDPQLKNLAQFAASQQQMRTDMARRRLEEQRNGYKISAWEYARQLATLKGIRVVLADYDAFEAASFSTAAGGESISKIAVGSNGKALAKNVNTQREYKARNTLKDWALEHLPETPLAPSQRKPKLALLFGSKHTEGLQEAFDNLGLDGKVTTMEATDDEGRKLEQVRRVAAETVANLMPFIMQNLALTQQPPIPKFAAQPEHHKEDDA